MSQQAVKVIYQCELCLTYCDEHGNHLSPQPRYGRDKIGVPESLVCNLCKVNPPPPAPTVPRARPRVQPAPSPRHPTGPVGIERSLPPERDFPETRQPTHNQHQAHFMRSDNADDQNRVMYRALMESFNLANPVPGKWVSNGELMRLGIGRPNSRAAQIREWPEMAQNELDVDSDQIPNAADNGKEWWAYRICRRSDSKRLARERERRPEQREQLLDD